MAPPAPIRVLVFGSTGVGKTSLCNALTGGARPTNNGPFGVTAKTHIYAPLRHGDSSVQIVDTAGLHESEGGTVNTETAVKQLIELLQSSKEGFHLLIHVARATRITKQQDEDHEFFVRRMTESKVPTLLVLTGCENEEPMSRWVDQHRKAFAKYQYAELIAACFAEGGKLETHYAPLRLESKRATLEAICRCALQQPHLLYGGASGRNFQESLFKLWNDFVELANLPEKWRRQTNEGAYALLKRLGVSERLAQLAVKHIPDLAEEIGAKLPIPGGGRLMRALSRIVLEKWARK